MTRLLFFVFCLFSGAWRLFPQFYQVRHPGIYSFSESYDCYRNRVIRVCMIVGYYKGC